MICMTGRIATSFCHLVHIYVEIALKSVQPYILFCIFSFSCCFLIYILCLGEFMSWAVTSCCGSYKQSPISPSICHCFCCFSTCLILMGNVSSHFSLSLLSGQKKLLFLVHSVIAYLRCYINRLWGHNQAAAASVVNKNRLFSRLCAHIYAVDIVRSLTTKVTYQCLYVGSLWMS